MTTPRFARSLVRKSKRALRSARIALQDGDPDGAVNRSYYAMFDIARAALLSAGVPEHELPRTHAGVIAAFGQHAVQSGLVDPELARSLGRTESLRLRADYTGTETDANRAADTVAHAETFVDTVERVFDLEGPYRESELDNDEPDSGSKVSEPSDGVGRMETSYPQPQPFSLEEERRQARENWLRLRQQQFQSDKASNREAPKDRAADADRGHSLDDDPDE